MVWLSATAAFAIIGCTWAFATARYGGPDEPAHVIRAAAAAHGDLRRQTGGRARAGIPPGDRADRAGDRRPCLLPARRDDHGGRARSLPPAAATSQVATSAGTAPPWYYVIVGGSRPRAVSSGGGVMAYRMAAVLLCAGHPRARAMSRSRRYGGGGGSLAALTPSAWFLIGVVGTSGVEIALVALALVEAVGRLRTPADVGFARPCLRSAGVCLVLRPAALIDIAVVALAAAADLLDPSPEARRRDWCCRS